MSAAEGMLKYNNGRKLKYSLFSMRSEVCGGGEQHRRKRSSWSSKKPLVNVTRKESEGV